MKGKVRLSKGINPLYKNGCFISLWNHQWEIIEEVKQAIYKKNVYSHLFIDAHLFCVVWWNDELRKWCGEVYAETGYVDTYICTLLEELGHEFLVDYYFSVF